MFKRHSRSLFSKLRVSAHTLMVEKGRYSSPKMPVHERICNQCDLNKVEDEYHFIIECSLYDSQRNKLFADLKEFLFLDNMSDNDIFTLIMFAKDFDILKIIINFVNTCFAIRKGKLLIIS